MSEEILLSTFTRLRGQLLQAARRLLPSQADAEDALQEAFVRLWPRAEEFCSEGQAEAVARTTVRHLGIDSYRRRRSHPTVSADAEDAPPLPDFCDEGADPDAEERWQLVESIMRERLTLVQRRIVQLRDFEGRSYEEIAASMEMQPAAVRMQLSRARRLVRDTFRELQLKNSGF